MRQMTAVTVLCMLVSFGMLVSPVAAETDVQQQSSAGVDQNAQVSGGTTHVQQDSHVRTETDDAVVEHRAELNATKEAGEPAEVERNVDRHVHNPGNASVSHDVNQQITEDTDTLTATQQITQGIEDTTDTLTPQTATAQANADIRGNATANTAAASDDPAVTTHRQAIPVELVTAVIDAIGNALPFL